jgi:hypothetical protein
VQNSAGLVALSLVLVVPLAACSRTGIRGEPLIVTVELPPPAPPAPEPTASASAVTPPAAPPAPPRPTIREEKDVIVGGVVEHWRLEWATPPVPSCQDPSETSLWYCRPFRYGERGDLDLVRTRDGKPEDRLALGPYVTELPRWPVHPGDDKANPGPDMTEVRRRPVVEVMKLGDYDHDGRATEFVLATSAGNPFGAYRSVLVGISRATEKLHFFGTTKLPDEPFVLSYEGQWERVRARVPIELPQVSCGDHGSPREVTYLIKPTPAGLDVTQRVYGCAGQRRGPTFVVEELEPCHGDGCY